MKNNNKLSFDQRCKIEEMINLRKRKFEIADEIDKTRSTVAREIMRHRKLKPSNLFNENAYNCKFFKDCKVCMVNVVYINKLNVLIEIDILVLVITVLS